jgi:hypothetical protein
LSQGLPPLPRRMRKAWMAAFARDMVGDAPPVFEVRLVDGGLYLEGGLSALLRLEVLRAKGERSLSVNVTRKNAIGCDSSCVAPTCPLAS